MHKHITYEEWISEQKIISFVDFLTDDKQNGSSIPITFEKFMEIKHELFIIYFHEKYVWNLITCDFEHYRDFINKVEKAFSIIEY